MPKLKTRKAIAKRFRLSSKGKLFHTKAGKRHLMSGKGSQRRRRLRGHKRVYRTQEMSLIKGLPVGA